MGGLLAIVALGLVARARFSKTLLHSVHVAKETVVTQRTDVCANKQTALF
jgi:hypothetical protein